MLNKIKKFFAAAVPVASQPTTTAAKAPTINIINKSTLLNEKDFAAMVEACKTQLVQHVAPLWQKGTWDIVSGQPENVGIPIVILDNPDQAGALGYHTESPGGKMWGRVFVRPVLASKGTMLSGAMSVSAVLSHEVIEAFCDPNVNLWAQRGDGQLIAYEACDPVENDSYEVTISSGAKVSVSNFVLPTWFDALAPGDVKFDYMSKLKAPFAMSKGGYIVIMNPKTGSVKNVFGSEEAEALHAARQGGPHPAARSTRKKSKHES